MASEKNWELMRKYSEDLKKLKPGQTWRDVYPDEWKLAAVEQGLYEKNGEKEIVLSISERDAIRLGIARIQWLDEPGSPCLYPVVVYDVDQAHATREAQKAAEHRQYAEDKVWEQRINDASE